MTQSQLADEMGVSQSYISQIENGQKQLFPYSQTMRRKSEYASNTKSNRQKRSPTAIASGNPSHAFSLAWPYIREGLIQQLQGHGIPPAPFVPLSITVSGNEAQ